MKFRVAVTSAEFKEKRGRMSRIEEVEQEIAKLREKLSQRNLMAEAAIVLRAQLAAVEKERDEANIKLAAMEADEELAKLRAKLAKALYRVHCKACDVEYANDAGLELVEKLAASEAREVGLIGALERLKRSNGGLWPTELEIVNEALSTEPPALLGVLKEVQEALVKNASQSHDPKNCSLGCPFCISDRALASLRAAMGVRG